jgi:murein L,D-transpeptidase YafK
MKTTLLALLFSITSANAFAKGDVKLVRVYKSERRLELIGSDNQVIKTYKVMLGRTPVGAKTQEGDNKTPEGTYELDQKNPDSDFHKSLHISYPNLKDKLKARMKGVSPGGDIMLHGLPNDFVEMRDWLNSVGIGDIGDEMIRAALPDLDWTNGCIAVSDAEIEEIYGMIDVPTKIIITP